MDCVLIQDNRAREIWRNTVKTQLTGKYAQAILDVIVETSNPVEVGFTWNGSAFLGQRWLIHTATGEFISGGYYDPVAPDADHSIVNTGAIIPKPRTEKWNGSAVTTKTAQEITDFDSKAERRVDSMTVMERMTEAECLWFWNRATTDGKLSRLLMMWLARDGTVNMHDPRTKLGWAYAKSVAVPELWANAATADSRIATITA